MGMAVPKGRCPLCLGRLDAAGDCTNCYSTRAEIKARIRARFRGAAAAKYHNRKVVAAAPGREMLAFDSAREARRFDELALLQRGGAISLLSRQEWFRLVVNGRLVCSYVADFTYIDLATGRFVVEDAKGVRTRAYRIKRKLFEALTGYEITEV